MSFKARGSGIMLYHVVVNYYDFSKITSTDSTTETQQTTHTSVRQSTNVACTMSLHPRNSTAMVLALSEDEQPGIIQFYCNIVVNHKSR